MVNRNCPCPQRWLLLLLPNKCLPFPESSSHDHAMAQDLDVLRCRVGCRGHAACVCDAKTERTRHPSLAGSSTRFDSGWWLGGWALVVGGWVVWHWWLVVGCRALAVGGVVGGWWLGIGGWWLVIWALGCLGIGGWALVVGPLGCPGICAWALAVGGWVSVVGCLCRRYLVG